MTKTFKRSIPLKSGGLLHVLTDDGETVRLRLRGIEVDLSSSDVETLRSVLMEAIYFDSLAVRQQKEKEAQARREQRAAFIGPQEPVLQQVNRLMQSFQDEAISRFYEEESPFIKVFTLTAQ